MRLAVKSKGGGKGKGQDGGEGGGSIEGTEHATVMYKNLNPENAAFVNLLVERAEVSMIIQWSSVCVRARVCAGACVRGKFF